MKYHILKQVLLYYILRYMIIVFAFSSFCDILSNIVAVDMQLGGILNGKKEDDQGVDR